MYVKIFSSLFDGSMRGHSDLILVFVNVLCHADQDGIVDRTCQTISDETGLSLRRVEAAITALEGIDKEAVTSVFDGHWIKKFDCKSRHGWIIQIKPERFNHPCIEVWKIIKARIFRRDNYTCRYCGDRGVLLECDHITPLSRGGNNDDENLTAACSACNRSKSAKMIHEWKRENK